MQTTEKCDTLRIANGWLVCECGRKIVRVYPDTSAANLEVFCRYCKRKFKVDISRGERLQAHSP